ncbi:CoA transferase [uncultured Brevibacillus sp.]|uniref:CoA transferase n=1 Tax=uncultured Brevibacillus sp. TaxID=169970 RepID=UPI002592518F|nr:CoA transferase [uncultured Brevibacillus sp.]
MQQALQNMKVIDLTQVLAGPYCTMVLGDLGADVIKVEKYPHGDDSRIMGPYVEEESYSYMMANRNKRGIRLNIKEEAGLGPAPLLGQHTKEVLAELKYSEEKIRALEENKII